MKKLSVVAQSCNPALGKWRQEVISRKLGEPGPSETLSQNTEMGSRAGNMAQQVRALTRYRIPRMHLKVGTGGVETGRS